MADTSFGPKFYRKHGGDEMVVASGGKLTVEAGGEINHNYLERNIRMRCTAAEVNAGKTILAAVAGCKYRMVDCVAIAIGGAAGAVTTVDVLGTQTSGVKLVAFGQASLTQSSVLKAGGTGATVLADGASYVANDVNTAVTVGKTGSAMTTATHVDIILTYVIECV